MPIESPAPHDDLAGALARLEERLAATRGRLAAQDERLGRVRDELRRLNTGLAHVADRGVAAAPAPAAPPIETVRVSWAPALSFVLVTLVAVFLRQHRPIAAASAVRLQDAVAAPPAMEAPRGDNDVAQGLRLIYAYRPTAARITVGEILEPMLGRELKPSSFEVFPAEGEAFRVVFKPFTDDVGLAHQYEFLVDPAKSFVQPQLATRQLLKVDAAGRLASRSDFEGLRQALDLSGEGEVLVGQPPRRVGR